MELTPKKYRGHTYINWSRGYELHHILNDEGHKSQVLIYKLRQEKLAKTLVEEYNAELRAEGKLNILYSVWFKTEEDVNRAIDYMDSLEVMKSLVRANNIPFVVD